MTQAAYRADGALVSRAAFYAVACDPQRSVVVEACAGAGKTWMLVSRILRALLAGAEPHEILAITFTRKAAGEMRQRLDDWLREFGSQQATDAQRTQALIDRGVPAADAPALAQQLAGLHERVLCSGRAVEVRTFHAWFAQLLRAAPMELLTELGLQPDMQLIEDPQDHRSDVFRRFHAALLRAPQLRADHAALVRQRGRSSARKWLEAAWDKRVEFELADAAGTLDASVPPPATDPPGTHPAAALLGAPWRALMRELALALGLGGSKAQDAATGLVMALANTDAQAAFDAAWAALFTTTGTPRKRLGKIDGLAAAQDALAEIAVQIRQFHAHAEHLRMVRLARLLLAEFDAYKRARGLADMADLERCGLALLRDATLAGWVQERLDARIRHVLIDEFQDTSPLQWHALHAWLGAYAGAGGGASGQRPPGVFIVGDPKQSIYRFRRAEPRVFEAAREFVVQALGGTLLECDHTRRNAPEVIGVLNTVFTQASAAGEFSGFRAHTTEIAAVPGARVFSLGRVLRPAKAPSSDAPAVWRDTLTTPRTEAEEVLREREAALVATAVQALLAGQGGGVGVGGMSGAGAAAASGPEAAALRPGEIIVLCRKRESLRLVAHALQRLHVPCAAVEDHALMDAPEARDLIAVLDVLVSPDHRLALAQALRSPLFGASDADLTALAQRAAGADWWAALQCDWLEHPNLQRAASLLAAWQLAAARLPPHDLLDRIVHEGDLHARVAATVPAAQRVAALDAVDALLGQALSLDGARHATPYNFVRALKRRAIKVAAPAQPDAVQLLTVHGAKGLEARVVFVMDADPSPRKAETTTLLIEWPVESEAPLRCAFVYSEAGCAPSLDVLLAAEMQARDREELNGLYVAMSRAKERLVFSATEPHRAAPRAPWWARVEPLATAWVPAATPPAAPNRAAPTAVARAPGDAPPIMLKQLPTWRNAATSGPAPDRAAPIERSPDTDATRLGKAVHRALEWASAGGGHEAANADVAALAHAAAVEFGAPAAATERIARTVLQSPACARFWPGAPGLRWAGNEVPVGADGEALRIDRLVLIDADGASPQWWVLDYKLQHTPEQLPAYRAQMLRYRSAVQRAQPGAVVRCAFVTGAGAVIEVDVTGEGQPS